MLKAENCERSVLDAYKLTGWRAIWMRMKPTAEQKRHLFQFLVVLVLIVVCHQFFLTRLLLYPFVLISTVFHEFGHALMTLLTGGRVANIEINPNESGVTRFVGGWPCFILPSGYLGNSLAGAALLVTSFGHKSSIVASGGTVLILLLTIYWSGSIFTVLSSGFMCAALGAAYFYAPQHLTKLILFMGTMGSLTAVLSIFSHLISNTIEGSDAVQFARQCSIFVPSAVFGTLWMIFSILIISGSLALGLYLYK